MQTTQFLTKGEHEHSVILPLLSCLGISDRGDGFWSVSFIQPSNRRVRQARWVTSNKKFVMECNEVSRSTFSIVFDPTSL
ncbi:hypothetical protein PILCRDRAFT_826269 [Piloderma croceum F 1598]|uniref:Uncharacterized protein n=1 Tax=Piloderma croceum (strain F 1598) TaxID=765440 RepID=A0A0C3F9S6_PILCF|nr:hypothetical protein PILCRDRAFT_826269 [Piloderma croceum F 1598]